MKDIIYSKFVERNFRLIPKYLSKYASLLEDVKSIVNYYILRRRTLPKIKITRLAVVPTTICNANCVFCGNCKLKDKRSIMSFEMFKKIADDYLGNPKSFAESSFDQNPPIGECMTDPKFFKKVKYLKDKGISSGIYTNGLLIGNYLNEIIGSGLDRIFIDFADINPKFDSKVFGISEEMSNYRIKSILKFLEVVEKTDASIEVILNFRSMRTPNQIIKEMYGTPFIKYYKENKIKFSFMQNYDNWGGLIKKENLLGIQTLKRVPKIKKYPCRNLTTISILPNGDIRPCGCRCLDTLKDELVIGNIKDTSLKDLYNSKKLKKIMKGFEKGQFPKVCNNCGLYRPNINYSS